MTKINLIGEANAIISDTKDIGSLPPLMEFNDNFSFPSVRKRVLQRIGHQFADDQSTRHSSFNAEKHIPDIYSQLNRGNVTMVGAKQIPRQFTHVRREVNP